MNQQNIDMPTIEQLNLLLDQMDQKQPATSQLRVLAASLELELQQLEQDAQAARQDKAKFISVVTHELRLPLTSIKGYSDLLRQGLVGPLNDQQANFINVIRTNADRMAVLISDLSDMSHIQSGRLKLQPRMVNPVSLIDELKLVWQPRFQEKNQEFYIQSGESIQHMQLDAERFKQILGYLLSNANRYTQENGRIELQMKNQPETLRIEIQDNGIGINLEDQKRLFTSFFRSEEEAVRQLPGWGLSLYVARLLVELMGGKIGAVSQPGEGSTFWLEIPIST